jgi:hypothetical protein
MLIADANHDNKIADNVQLLQRDCLSMLKELRSFLSEEGFEGKARERSAPPPSREVSR